MYKKYRNTHVSELIGKILTNIDVNVDKIIFTCLDSKKYAMYHSQDCCESVTIEDIIGDLENLIGSPIIMAEEETNEDNPKDDGNDSHTWTFYKLATNKGYVTIRWYGESNGCYSEEVDFSEIIEK